MDTLALLLEQTIRRYVCPDARIVSFDAQPLGEGERGYSGARLNRHAVTFRTPQGATAAVTLITKEASLLERRALDWLTTQGQCVPYSHTLDLTTDRPALVCQQDLGAEPPPSQQPPSPNVERRVARGLARIHHMNLGRARELSWLPRADRAYVEDRILADYRGQLARAMERPEFVAEYGDVARRMEEAVVPFLAAMDALWEEGESLTLIHADISSDHVRVRDGRPYIIDWGQARYGPFYLDLPNYFTPRTVLFYREALAELGLDIPEGEFMRRYGEAGRYPGFKYIGFVLSLWTKGQLDSLRGPLLDQLLHGRTL